MKISVLMILQSDFPPDIRVEKEIQSLNATGKYSITLLCNNKTGKASYENFKDIKIIRLPFWPIFGLKINFVKNFPLWFNPIWIIWGVLSLIKSRPQIIHVHDLPLMMLGLIFARLVNAKLVYDLHENYPATFDVWKKGGIFRPLVRNKHLAQIYDRFCLLKTDRAVVVEPEHIGWIKQYYGIDRPMSVVSNTVDLLSYPEIKINLEIVDKFKKYLVVSYVGQISVERDLEVALKALVILKETVKHILFIIVGEGPDRERLQNITNKLGLENKVVFTGWIPFKETATYIHLSEICLIPQGSNDLIDNGTPHKLFQYMVLGKPVIVSDAKAMSRIVKEENCGLVFKSKDEKSLANAVLTLLKNENNFGKKGIEAVNNKYNWQRASEELIRLYESVI